MQSAVSLFAAAAFELLRPPNFIERLEKVWYAGRSWNLLQFNLAFSAEYINCRCENVGACLKVSTKNARSQILVDA